MVKFIFRVLPEIEFGILGMIVIGIPLGVALIAVTSYISTVMARHSAGQLSSGVAVACGLFSIACIAHIVLLALGMVGDVMKTTIENAKEAYEDED